MDDKIYDKIQTFLFFDLETSDLIKGKKFPSTTELSMVGVSRDSIKVDQRNKLALPRIMHKLTLAINPMVPINAQASHASSEFLYFFLLSNKGLSTNFCFQICGMTLLNNISLSMNLRVTLFYSLWEDCQLLYVLWLIMEIILTIRYFYLSLTE